MMTHQKHGHPTPPGKQSQGGPSVEESANQEMVDARVAPSREQDDCHFDAYAEVAH